MLPIDPPTPETFITKRIAEHGARSRRARSKEAKAVKAHRQRRDDRKARIEALNDAQAAARSFRKFEREMLRNRYLWRPLRSRKADRAPPDFRRKSKPDWRPTRITITPRIDTVDRAGRRGIFLKIHFDGAASNQFGVMRRRVLYAALSKDAFIDFDGNALLISNVANDIAEAAVVADEIEAYNRAERKNAKLSINFVVGFPRGSTALVQEQILRQFCQRAFGDRDLPYIANIHHPMRGDAVHNPHAHVTASFRPVVRMGAYSYLIGKELRTDLDGEEGMLAIRKILAEVTTKVMRQAGLDRRYTHLSNCARGLPLIPQESLTEGENEQAKRGEYVPRAERNRRRVLASASWSWDQIKARVAEQFEGSQTKADRPLPSTPIQVPQGKMARLCKPIERLVLPLIKRPTAPSNWVAIEPRARSSEAVSAPLRSLERQIVRRVEVPGDMPTAIKQRTRSNASISVANHPSIRTPEWIAVPKPAALTKAIDPVLVAAEDARTDRPGIVRSPHPATMLATPKPAPKEPAIAWPPKVAFAPHARLLSAMTINSLPSKSVLQNAAPALLRPALQKTLAMVGRERSPALATPKVRERRVRPLPLPARISSASLRQLSRGDRPPPTVTAPVTRAASFAILKPTRTIAPHRVTMPSIIASPVKLQLPGASTSLLLIFPRSAWPTALQAVVVVAPASMSRIATVSSYDLSLPRVEYSTKGSSTLSAAKENADRELSAADCEQLMLRLERDRPRLELKDGLVQPVNLRAFSHAERAWMRQDMLMMARLYLEQQSADEAAEKRECENRRIIEARRLAARPGAAGPAEGSKDDRTNDDREASLITQERSASISDRVRDVGTMQRGLTIDKAISPPRSGVETASAVEDAVKLAAHAAWAAAQNRGR